MLVRANKPVANSQIVPHLFCSFFLKKKWGMRIRVADVQGKGISSDKSLEHTSRKMAIRNKCKLTPPLLEGFPSKYFISLIKLTINSYTIQLVIKTLYNCKITTVNRALIDFFT